MCGKDVDYRGRKKEKNGGKGKGKGTIWGERGIEWSLGGEERKRGERGKGGKG